MVNKKNRAALEALISDWRNTGGFEKKMDELEVINMLADELEATLNKL